MTGDAAAPSPALPSEPADWGLFQVLLHSALSSLRATAYAAAAMLTALLLGGVLLLVSRYNPVDAYGALFSGGFGSLDNFSVTVNDSAPLLVGAVGFVIAIRAGVINIGQEGQFSLGGVGAAMVGLQPWIGSLPSALAILLCLAAGFLFGAAWASIAGILRIWRGANEIIVTLLLGFVGLRLTTWLAAGPLYDPGQGFPESKALAPNTSLPLLYAAGGMHIGILIALAAALLGWSYLRYSRSGFSLRIVGASASAGRYAGLPINRLALLALALSGGLAGLGGAILILGVQFRLVDGFALGLGFTSVAVALVAGTNPLSCIPVALFFGFLEAGGQQMAQFGGVPSALTSAIEGVAILFVLVGLAVDERRRRRARHAPRRGGAP